MKFNIYLIAALLLVLFICGCNKVDRNSLSDQGMERPSQDIIVCNPPYIRYAADCCLDENDNSVCDKDEQNGTQDAAREETKSNVVASDYKEIPVNINTSPSSTNIAETALSAGTRIIDRTGDWVPTGNSEDNPSPYHIEFTDIKEVDVGIDDNNLYVRSIFNGKWPKNDNEWPSINGDQITDTGFTIMIDTDNNPQTGCLSDGGTEIDLEYGTRMNNPYGNPPGTWNGYKVNPSGIEFPEEKRYLNDYNINTPMIGGPGYDYVINIYPLKDLNLAVGQEVTLKIKAEAMSKKYHHATFDDMNFLNGPSQSKLVVKLGENKIINFS